MSLNIRKSIYRKTVTAVVVILSVPLALYYALTLLGGIRDSFLEEPRFPRGDWRYIVIHHSGTPAGNAQVFHADHYFKYNGLAYHFVINNGWGQRDGMVQASGRWMEQRAGAHVTGDQDRYNRYGIGICLVGDFTRSRPTGKQMAALARLARLLMARYGIVPENILGHNEVPFDNDPSRRSPTLCPGRLFPISDFRRLMEGQARVP